MSLNISVTSPSVLTAPLISGRRVSTDEATRRMEALTLLDSLPWARILSASTRSSQAEPAPMRRKEQAPRRASRATGRAVGPLTIDANAAERTVLACGSREWGQLALASFFTLIRLADG